MLRQLVQAGSALGGLAWTAPALAPVFPPMAGPLGIRLRVSSPDANFPYTLDVDPYTKRLRERLPFTASRSRWVAVTLHPRYRSKSVQLATSPGMAARW